MTEVNHSDPGRPCLVSRTDAIGDVILTLPVCQRLKQLAPDKPVWFLARDYTRAVIEACPAVDRFISWDALQGVPPAEQARALRETNADTIVHVFPNRQIAAAARSAGIRHRIGTSRRWYHWLTCSHRVRLSRKNSSLHEAQLNLRLLEPLDSAQVAAAADLRPTLKPQIDVPANTRALIDGEKFNLVIHPFSHGSARNWPADHIISLIHSLKSAPVRVFLSGTPKESAEIRQQLLPHLGDAGVVDISGQLNLAEFIAFLAQVDGLIAGSTGPLHIAAALGIRALGLYPPKGSMRLERWHPLGAQASAINCFSSSADPQTTCDKPCQPNDCGCMVAIHPAVVREWVAKWDERNST